MTKDEHPEFITQSSIFVCTAESICDNRQVH
jgi:hypothetical protein